MKKERVDVLVLEQGLVESREQAKRSVMAGLVCDDKHQRYDKPGEKVPVDTVFQLKGKMNPYASRGGLKLEKALDDFAISVEGKTVLDIGASTGGFTDLMLQRGAKLSYALDVGYNQLAWRLRQDERVVVMERTNFRYSKPEDFLEGLPTFASIDVSFISLRLILPVLKDILCDHGEVVALIKPQFEAGKENVGKKGIVRDASVHEQVVEEMLQFAQSEGYDICHLTYSPITGGEGNIEFLMHLQLNRQKEAGERLTTVPSVERIVLDAHQQLDKH